MKRQTITAERLAEVLVVSYKYNNEVEYRATCLAYMVLFDGDLYAEACMLASKMMD